MVRAFVLRRGALGLPAGAVVDVDRTKGRARVGFWLSAADTVDLLTSGLLEEVPPPPVAARPAGPSDTPPFPGVLPLRPRQGQAQAG